MMFSRQISIFAFVLGCVWAAPSVTVTNGTLNGGVCDGTSSAVYYKSIPFAKAPTGDLRFASPEPFDQTYEGGTLDAAKAAPACIQFGSTFFENGPRSEDCLYLDVWAPQNATSNSGLPVRAWVYGGSETTGGISDPLYDGCSVAGSGVIQVSINYRLGPLGFLALNNASIPGNMAIQDLLLGLQWVQENIQAFGGDPKKVVLHGQSAGAMNAFALATLPQASQLFSAAILQSGGGRDYEYISQGNEIGQAFATAAGCESSIISCLRSKSTSDLNATYTQFSATLPGPGHFYGLDVTTAASTGTSPYVDGKIIPRQPSIAGVQVPSVFGFNSQDGSLFVGEAFGTSVTSITADNYTAFLEANFGSSGAAAVEQYIPFSAFSSEGVFQGFAALTYVYTAAQYQCPAHRGAVRAAEKNIPVWVYDFAHTPSCPWLQGVSQQELRFLGPCHTAELPFVFGNTQNLPLPNGTCSLSDDEVKLSEFMSSAWTSMAATQKPVADASSWPAFAGANKTLGLTIANSTIPGNVNFTICELFDYLDGEILANATAAAGNSSSSGGNGTATASGTATSSASSTATGSTAPTPNSGASSHLINTMSLVLILLGAFSLHF